MKISNKLVVALLLTLAMGCSRDCISPDPACAAVMMTNSVDGTDINDEPGVDYPGPAIGVDGTDLTGEEGQTGTSTEFSMERGTFALSDEELEALIAYFQSKKAEEEASQPTTPEVWASETQCESDEDCNDGQGCTTDTCDGGLCSYTQVEGCKPCQVDSDCKADKVCNVSSLSILAYKCEEDSTCQPFMGAGQFCNNWCTSEPEVVCLDECQTDTDCGGVDEDLCMRNYCILAGNAGNSCRYNEPIEGCVLPVYPPSPCETDKDCFWPERQVCFNGMCTEAELSTEIGDGNVCETNADCSESVWGAICVNNSPTPGFCHECRPDGDDSNGIDEGCTADRPQCFYGSWGWPWLGIEYRPFYACETI